MAEKRLAGYAGIVRFGLARIQAWKMPARDSQLGINVGGGEVDLIQFQPKPRDVPERPDNLSESR